MLKFNLMEPVLSVGFLITQQQKLWQGCSNPSRCSNQLGDISKCWAQLGQVGVLVEMDRVKLESILQKTLKAEVCF